MKKLMMIVGGRRNKVGSMHGPRNEESVNGTHPCLAVSLQINTDVQLPYRFAVTELTHDTSMCAEACVHASTMGFVITAMQNSQDAQLGLHLRLSEQASREI